MRKLLLILVAAMLAGVGTFGSAGAPVAQAATNPKVAIIVGATHDSTARYRSYADDIYDAARKYTTNVVKVYSPSATWTKVKAAVNGASVIVYLGHGNGWPSPYTYDPNYTTKDGFGLNYDVNGDGKLSDYELKYYGEPSIRTLTPAPNAVVLLFHLCYASGNSEPGNANPSLTTAKQRVDNYAAGFLKAGARAVIANGHSHADYYIDALFNTRQSILDYWRHAPDYHGGTAVYASTRSPGYSFSMDPEAAGSYYRAITGKLTLQTRDVTGANYADTSADPSVQAVPGNATPKLDGSPVYGSVENAVAGLDPVATLGTSARVRVDAKEPAVSIVDASPVYRMHTDDGVEGWMTGSALTPRDSAAPRVWEVDDGVGAFSPNGDDTQDAYGLSIRLSESSAWHVRIVDGDGTERASAKGTSDTAAMTWAPAKGEAPDGTYRWVLDASDAWGNGPLDADGTVKVDTARPEVSVADAASDVMPTFTPNGDGASDTIGFSVDSSEPGSVTGTVRDAGDQSVATISANLGTGAASVTWNGRKGSAYAPDGVYSIGFVAKDLAGNRSEPQVRSVAVYGALAFTKSSKTVFFPQDGDGLAATTSLTFTLFSPATVDWTIQNAAGTTVRTLKAGEALPAGDHAVSWNGRDDAGAYVPRGSYRSVVTATDGTLSSSQRASFVADAFTIAVSDATPARKQRITVTTTSAENLDAAPRLRVYQPGIAAWSVTMTKVATRVYRASVTLKSSSTGTLRLRIGGHDANGVLQESNRYLPLH